MSKIQKINSNIEKVIFEPFKFFGIILNLSVPHSAELLLGDTDEEFKSFFLLMILLDFIKG